MIYLKGVKDHVGFINLNNYLTDEEYKLVEVAVGDDPKAFIANESVILEVSAKRNKDDVRVELADVLSKLNPA
jgi:hypothetical protein